MNQDQANAIGQKIDRAVEIFFAALWTILSLVGFTWAAHLWSLPLAIACVLISPVLLVSASMKWRTRPPQMTNAILLALLGFGGALASVVVALTPFEILATILAWFGVTILAVSNLLLVFALGGALLTRLRASA